MSKEIAKCRIRTAIGFIKHHTSRPYSSGLIEAIELLNQALKELEKEEKMDKNEARKAAEVMLAYADGREIETSDRDMNEWSEADAPCFDWSARDYRIKPQPKYRPFNSAEECWQEMQKHQPFGWVKSDDPNIGFVQINQVEENQRKDDELLIWYAGSSNNTAEGIFKLLTFADGEPFGVKEE